MESKYSDDEMESKEDRKDEKLSAKHSEELKGGGADEKKIMDGDFLIDQLQKYFYEDSALGIEFENFVKERSVIIDLETEEYKLAYTEVYNEYRELFERRMENHIVELGYSPVEFYKVLQGKIESESNGSVALFAQILLGVTEFDIFMQMMREAARQFHSKADRK
jgi:hypothetical protein